MVSRKLWLNLWRFNLLRPTLSWVRYDKPIASWIPKTDSAGGWIFESNFFLEIAADDAALFPNIIYSIHTLLFIINGIHLINCWTGIHSCKFGLYASNLFTHLGIILQVRYYYWVTLVELCRWLLNYIFVLCVSKIAKFPRLQFWQI